MLIIDDEKAILKLLSKILTKHGYEVDTAENGQDGINKFLSNSYHIVLTDIKMPGLSGEQVLTEIKRISSDAIFVVGMSGTPWLLNRESFDAVLEKPIESKDLLSLLGKLTL